jgi:hypothetical protein
LSHSAPLSLIGRNLLDRDSPHVRPLT